MTLEYKSKYGTLRFTGGKSGGWRITQIKGLGPPEGEYTYHTFSGMHGQKLASVRYTARTISVKCDIYPEDVSPQKGAKILSGEGVLTIHIGRRIRKLACRCTSFTKQECRSAVSEAVIQFVADSPFFYGDSTEKDAAKTVPLLSTPFTLPCIFSERTMETTFFVSGDVEAEPMISLSVHEDIEAFTVTNRTTGAFLTFDGGFSAGDEIVVDIEKRTAVSSRLGSVLNRLSDDSYLSRFTLDEGENTVAVTAAGNVSCTVSFRNRYREAMY